VHGIAVDQMFLFPGRRVLGFIIVVHYRKYGKYGKNRMKNFILIFPAAVGLIATVITSQVQTPVVEAVPPYSTATYSSTSGAMVYQAQAAPTPTPVQTGGGTPLKA
jgi:hypothetical protein